MFRRPAFWIALLVISAASAALAVRLFPQAFPIVQLDLKMDREAALAAARALMTREQLGPDGYRQAASFTSDSEAQTFVELEGGGKDVYAQMLRDGLYAGYTWQVRQFKEGEKHETLIRFRPDGQPYGFREQIEESAPGAALAPDAARAIAETKAREAWQMDLAPFALVEQSQERRPGGRVDHAFTYERSQPTLNDGRYRLRLVVSGDRLTEATHFIKIPEAFTRRYEEMRAANEAIGAFASVSMVLLYVVCGIAIGLFWLLRQRYVIGRTPVIWGVVIGVLQLASSLNDWPLMWMAYDTAVPRATFIGQQIASMLASFVGFSMFFGLSFMAAESLTRRAFGRHAQLWRVWSPEAASSWTVLGTTLAGYLLVALFFAYDVLLYFYATRLFGWWAPSDALIHPDVLASYFPWVSAIANSLQAGFWEESLFRAVPIAGAALIGDRFGKRNLFIVIAFVIQSIVFGAGHAPYPTQPSYSRPVELIVPSIGFGLLYLNFGLLPGIILHYTFDAVWFALPLFVSSASGIWIDRAMVILLTLVPLWIVLAARMRRGAWHELPAEDRNAAWIPPPAPPAPPVRETAPEVTPLTARFIRAWALIGVLALVVWVAVEPFRPLAPPLRASLDEAARAAREAVAGRGFQVGPAWRVMPIADDGHGDSHRFVWDEGGRDRYASLLGRYLPTPRWLVRVATFEGDVADRAEEWTVLVNHRGQAERVAHQIPESRAAPSLDESAARQIALDAVQQTLALPASSLREVSVAPSKLAARTDWLFTFQDTTVETIPIRAAAPNAPANASAVRGEARIEVEIGGRDAVRVRPFVHVPEEWQRQQRGRDTLLRIIGILGAVLAGSTLVAAAGSGLVAWSHREFSRRIFVSLFVLFAVLSIVVAVNNWPTVTATLSTAQPYALQVWMRVGIGLVALLVPAALLGLAGGTLALEMPLRRQIPRTTAAILGMSLGFVVLAAAAATRAGGEPPWPDVSALGTFVPPLAAAIGRLPSLLLRTVTLMVLLSVVDHMSRGWTRQRVLLGLALIVAGAVLAAPPADTMLGWVVAAALVGVVFLCAYIFLLRFDMSIVPFAMATIVGASLLRDALSGTALGVAAGSIAGIVLAAVMAWWICGQLREARARQATPPA